MSYATVAQMRQYLGQVPPSAAHEDLLQAVLDRATSMIRATLQAQLGDPGFEFAAYGAPSTAIITGTPSRYLVIPPHEAGSVSLVEYQSIASPITWAAVVGEWAEESGRLYRPSGWYFDRYRVTAVWGYGPVPDSIVELCLELAVNLWRAKDRGGYTEVVGVEGSGGLRVISGLNAQQRQIIADLVTLYWQVAI